VLASPSARVIGRRRFVGRAADPIASMLGAVPASAYATATSELAAMNAQIGAADASLDNTRTAAGAAWSSADYSAAVKTYQAAGQMGATQIGPAIDAAGNPGATQALTQKAWALNGELASIESTATGAASSYQDAQEAQAYSKAMASDYSQAIAAGQGASSTSSPAPTNLPPPPLPPLTTATPGTGPAPSSATVDAGFPAALWQFFKSTGIRPEWIVPVLFSESGLRPSIQNLQGYPYYGINQISGAYLAAHGIDPKTYLTWTASDQLTKIVTPYMQAQQGTFGPLLSGTRVYQANFLPATLATATTLAAVLASKPAAGCPSGTSSDYYCANQGLDRDKSGAINVSDLASFVAQEAALAAVQKVIADAYAVVPAGVGAETDPVYGNDWPAGASSTAPAAGASQEVPISNPTGTAPAAASSTTLGSSAPATAAVAVVGLLVAGGVGIAWLLARGGLASDSSSSYRGWERRREQSEFTAQNIPPEALPLWHRIGGQFRGTPHERFEAFGQYVEEHPGEVQSAQQDEADAQLEAAMGGEEHRGCRCVDGDSPRCCGRGCCSHHRGIKGPAGRRDHLRRRAAPAPRRRPRRSSDEVPF
jgi:hypothetical protein